MGVEGMGRVFTRVRGAVHANNCRRVCFAQALDLDLPLLHQLQHEFATRALRPRLAKRRRGFSLLTVDMRAARMAAC
jgi:hypothetical protein